MPIILNGKETGSLIREKISERVLMLKEKYNKVPGLAVIIVGEDSASKVYVRNKKKGCDEVGFLSRVYELACDTSESTLLSLINELNYDNDIHGILVQLPLPKHIDPDKVIEAILPSKDVDAFSEVNTGKIMIG